eukprot:2344028-Pyramimonas_sp.AAC.2
MYYTRCWVAPRQGHTRCVVAVAGGPQFGVLEWISCDLLVGCLRRLDSVLRPQRWTSKMHPVGVRVTPRGYVKYGARTRGVSPVGEPSSSK